MKQNQRIWKFKGSQGPTFVMMPQALSARRISISQFFMDSSIRSRLPHHTAYKPSIFGGRRKVSSNNESMDLSSPQQNFNPVLGSGMNLVLEFEKHLL